MARTKILNIVVSYKGTGYYINDLGETKSPRFELYYEPEAKVIFKTNNPIDCNKWVQENIWREFYGDTVSEEKADGTASPKRRSRKTTKSNS